MRVGEQKNAPPRYIVAGPACENRRKSLGGGAMSRFFGDAFHFDRAFRRSIGR